MTSNLKNTRKSKVKLGGPRKRGVFSKRGSLWPPKVGGFHRVFDVLSDPSYTPGEHLKLRKDQM